ncbi:GNAT family protein [Flagellimonas sp. DF-77]|uniref:GNAT family N-acetyltransferase n=1 Tax=Flagellimonas algarum TaxID=3230298 RepID=UPI0033993BC8
MDFTKKYLLENERVRLEPMQFRHQRFLEGFASERAIWKFLLGSADGSSDFTAYFKHMMGEKSMGRQYPFAIYDKLKQCYAGSTRVYDVSEDGRSARIGHTWIGRDFWGSQLNEHLKFLLFDWLFGPLDVQRVGFGVHSENHRSLGAMRKVGCIEEGRVRHMFPSLEGANAADAVLFGMLKEEWMGTHKNQLKQSL